MEHVKSQSLFDVIQCLKSFSKYAKSRILVVDDEEFCLSSMKVMLNKLGIDTEKQVDFCMNGIEALEMAS
jgi:CheY-like chemotaxis protein